MTAPTQDARANDAVMLELVKTIQVDVSAMQETLSDHIATEPKEWALVLENLMKKSFPAGDPDGHRKAHEAQIQEILDRAQFWKTLRMEAAKYGVLGVLGWLLYHAWVAFLHGPAK